LFESDPERAGYKIYNTIKPYQNSINSTENCRKLVIAVIHGIFYGLGVNLVAACGIRFCSNDIIFAVKESDIGIPAYMHSLQ
jgi:enoyl-CoA hydratase/carnithine racemase